jgi:hypothetical protein
MSRADLRGHRPFLALTALVLVAGPAVANAQRSRSKLEEQRRKLLEGSGREKRDTPPAPAPPAAETPEDKADATSGPRPAPTAAPAPPSFRRAIHPLLVQTCKSCHAPGAAAGATALVLGGDAGTDHASVRRVLDVRAPAASAILTKASGQKLHAGGGPWPVGGAPYSRVLAWIQAGARLDGGGRSATPPPVATPGPAPGPPPRPVRKPEPPAEAAGTTASPESTPTADADAPAAAAPDDRSAPTSAPAADDFAATVHPLLVRACGACHGPVGTAAATRLVLSGEVAADYQKVRPLVDPAAPAAGLLLTKAAGDMHAGGPVLKPGSAEYAVLSSWVRAGALERPAAAPAGAAPPPGPAAGPVLAPPVRPAPAPPVEAITAASPRQPGAGGGLPMGFMLNGRFDLAYERRTFTGSPFGDGATNALRSYHHFLFLSRESASDPFGLSLELLTLQFWEAHYRWRAPRLPLHVLISGGKIFVPFGAEPLMHQSYGGLAGFDQRILPVVWAQEGAAVHLTYQRRALAITDDMYVVRGYALRAADGVLNLQNDFSPADDVKLGWGNRLGAAHGPLSAWYSTYYNPLGFGRRLFMQAIDVMLWRMRHVPVLGHFSLAAGAMRADISGGDDQGVGGPGKDYYHFGSYLQLRYHPTDWLTLQYRQGLRTFNNRRGAIVDDTRLTSEDASTHNFGLIARTRGMTVGAYYFINLEKGPEIRDDFFRLLVSYDF